MEGWRGKRAGLFGLVGKFLCLCLLRTERLPVLLESVAKGIQMSQWVADYVMFVS